MALGVQVKATEVVVGFPETIGFPGAEGATAVMKVLQEILDGNIILIHIPAVRKERNTVIIAEGKE